ncbi:MAG: GldG family protein [Polyangiaceae bacterium]
MEKRTRTAAVSLAYIAAVGILLLIANIASYRFFYRFDTTREDRFTLSQGSKRLVCEGLNQDLTVEVYVTKGLAKTDIFIQDLTDLLDEYQNASYKKKDGSKSPASKFKYTIIEPKTEDEKKAAKDAGLTEQLLGEGSETSDQATVATGFMGFVLKYGSEKDVIPFWPPDSTQGIEFFITNKIRELRDRADKIETKFGLITGKDELKISDNNIAPGGQPFNLQQIFQQYFPFYKFEDVDLQNGDAEINQELVGIIITQPTKDFTEKELRRIDEFLMRGNKAAVFYTSAVNLKASDPTMKATLNSHGLEKLFDGYGVEMKREAILDFGSSFRLPAQTNTGDQIWISAPGIVQVTYDDDDEATRQLDNKFAPFFRMTEIGFPFPSPLVPHADKQPKATLKVVARTSPRTSVDASDSVEMKYSNQWKETAPQEQKAIAISIEGQLTSAFAGKGDDMGIKPNAVTPEGLDSRILIVSSSQFLANPFARSGNPPPMPPQLQMMGQMPGDKELMMIARPYFEQTFRPLIFSFKNTLDWMANDADLIAVSAKMLGEPSLTYAAKKPKGDPNDNEETMKKKYEEYKKERADIQRTIQNSLIVLPALLFAIIGIVRWRLRESGRDRVQL